MTVAIGFAALQLVIAATPPALPSIEPAAELPSDTLTFRLASSETGYRLLLGSGDAVEDVAIPREWLVPPEDEKEEELDAYVSSFSFAETVNSFPIGDRLIGLHLSSYEIQKEGSANAAAGRDLFLVFDAENGEVWPGGLSLGITKSRMRALGCLYALSHTFLVGDVDTDGMRDIGVFREEVDCGDKEDEPSNPRYMRGPIRWHPFRRAERSWSYDSAYDNALPRGFAELPLIDLLKTPVEFVMQLLKSQ